MKFIIPEKYLQKKLIIVKKHPTLDLYNYNYTRKTQYNKLWDEITINARSLVLDDNHNIIARGYPHFNNLCETDKTFIPDEQFSIYEKLDGYLILIFSYQGKTIITSRGSFDSVFANKARELWNKNYNNVTLTPSLGYVFELFYAQHPIVLKHSSDDLILTGIVSDTGKTFSRKYYDQYPFKLVQKHDFADIKKGNDIYKLLRYSKEENREGFVVHFEKSDMRIKIKFDKYVSDSAALQHLNEITVWKYLTENRLSELIDLMPDEYDMWIRKQTSALKQAFSKIENECKQFMNNIPSEYTRKEKALIISASAKYKKTCLAMLSGKDYKKSIWKIIRPKIKPYSSKL